MADLPPIKGASSEGKFPTVETPFPTAELDAVPASSKDFMVGGGGLLVLAVVFFFIRNAYVNYLVGSLKRSPNNAGLAGWALFGCLLFGAAIGSAALISKSYLTLVVIAPLAVLSVICLVLCILVSSKK